MTETVIKFVKENASISDPYQKYSSDSGWDIENSETALIKPFERMKLPTGLAFDIPDGYELQVRPRSSGSLSGIDVQLGTIDAGYHGFIQISCINLTNSTIFIPKGVRLAQIVLAPKPKIVYKEVSSRDEFNESERNTNGFGSTRRSIDKLYSLSNDDDVNELITAYIDEFMKIAKMQADEDEYILTAPIAAMLTDKYPMIRIKSIMISLNTKLVLWKNTDNIIVIGESYDD